MVPNPLPESNQDLLLSLEWKKFLDLAESLGLSEPGRTLLRDLHSESNWAESVIEANEWQWETLEASQLLERSGIWGALENRMDPTPILDAIQKEAVPSLKELVELFRWCEVFESWLEFLNTLSPQEKIGIRIRGSITSLFDPHFLLKSFHQVIGPDGELSEKASPKLYSLRRERDSIRVEIQSKMAELVHKYHQAGVLQDSFGDVREGRLVLPVKPSERTKVQGAVLDFSISRHTLFVEPVELQILNNRLKQVEHDYETEVFEILQALSRKIAPHVQEIGESMAVVAHWDSVQARARLGRKYSGRQIRVVDERRFHLKFSAHPLLWWSLDESQIVRNNVEFLPPGRTLLLTGPNTGGKTVFLKTIGMAGICARTGFFFPGAGEATVPFFDGFFIDLGDSQSIEKHISSFSGHVLTFKRILENITPRSLILFDELNSATDPVEGAALSRSLLEAVNETEGVMTFATTHDPHLKGLSILDPNITAASFEFDEKTHLPTYRLVIGTPGRSRALETAERLGLPKRLLDRARSYLDEGQMRFDQLLSQMEARVQEVDRLRHEAKVAFDQAEALKAEWTERTEKGVADVMEKSRSKLKHLFEQAQDEIRGAVRRVEEMRKHREIDTIRQGVSEVFQRSQARMDQVIQEEAPDVAKALELEQKKNAPVAGTEALLEVGSLVRIAKLKSLGTVQEVSGSKVKVLLGLPNQVKTAGLHMTVSKWDLEVLGEAEAKKILLASGGGIASFKAKKGHSEAKIQYEGKFDASPDSIDLRGKQRQEALSELEQYLDRAYRGGRREVTVIHGLGTGAIRESARKLMEQLPYVKSFQDGGPGRGGSGATIVEFDQS